MRLVRRDPVDGERLEHVLEAHAVVGLLPHLLGEVEVALGRVDVGVHAERERLVDEQLVGVEVAHEEGERVALVVAHALEVGEVLTELDLVGEPRVGDGLVVQLHRPRVGDGLEQQAFGDAGAEDGHGGSRSLGSGW